MTLSATHMVKPKNAKKRIYISAKPKMICKQQMKHTWKAQKYIQTLKETYLESQKKCKENEHTCKAKKNIQTTKETYLESQKKCK